MLELELVKVGTILGMDKKISSADKAIASDIDSYFENQQNKHLLRFITCGSVDDGKSTLIGRLLYDSKTIFSDQLEQLEIESKKVGSQGQKIDFALLVDGLSAEREQGITIDVAYRFFSTEKRKFIVADTPGHEQFTRNMVTGASTAELAIILVDSRKGILTQTRRHGYLCHLLGVRKFVLAVNKMDLINYEQTRFNEIVADFQEFSDRIGITSFVAIPISGLLGKNVASRCNIMHWYEGPTLKKHLEDVEPCQQSTSIESFCLPIQWVNRPNPDFRGFSGRVVSGSVRPGDKVCILPSGKNTIVESIVTFDSNLKKAEVGQSITVKLKDEVDCSRGHIITSAETALQMADQFESSLIWMDATALVPGRQYYLKIGPQTVLASVDKPKYQINVNTMERRAAHVLELNTIGVANVTTDRPIPFANYSENRALGSFILIDRLSHATVCAGLINFAIRRSQNIQSWKTDITRDYRASIKNQKPAILWMTGLSGSGKSTIANAVEKKLALLNRHTFLLDGDNVRNGLNKDLSFNEADRVENIRRVGEVAKLMMDAGLIVITAFISPFRLEREMVRNMVKPDEFFEIFIDTPLHLAEERDVKGLYAKARSGKLRNFTGIDSPYEPPQMPDLRIDTTVSSIDEAADNIVELLLSASTDNR